MKQEFLLDPDVVFLNHGSFGATPQVVFEAYQEWQRRLEREPVRFFQRELPDALGSARSVLADFLGCDAGDLVFVPNPTFAMNTLAASLTRRLSLGPEDEVLTTDHEYGACTRAWEFYSQHHGFKIVQQPMLLAEDPALAADRFCQAITNRTKVIYISHITSPTAVRFPVAEIARRVAGSDVKLIVDGAHAPGQLPLHLESLNVDYYLGACHKWMCAAKGASFLYAGREQQAWIDPLVIGWGWGPDRTIVVGSDFLDGHQWLGTRDLSAYLSVPAAIEFQQRHEWPSHQDDCRQLVLAATEEGNRITGSPVPLDRHAVRQMGLIELPGIDSGEEFQRNLFNQFRIEIPVTKWHDRHFLRISVQAYNDAADVEALMTALRTFFP